MSAIKMPEAIRYYGNFKSELIGVIAAPAILAVSFVVLGAFGIMSVAFTFAMLLLAAFTGGFITTYLYGNTPDEQENQQVEEHAWGAWSAAIGIGILFLLFILYELVIGASSVVGFVGNLIAVAIVGGIAFGAGLGGDWIALRTNERRLANIYEDRFETTANDYRRKLSRVKECVDNGQLGEAKELLEEVQTLRQRCERIKSRHDISTSLWSVNQQYAEMHGVVASERIQSLLDKAREAEGRGDLEVAADKMGKVVDLASKAHEDATTYNADINLPIATERAKKERASITVQKKADEVGDLLSLAERSASSGDVSTAKSHLETAQTLVDDIEDLESEYSVSVPSSLTRDIDREKRRLVEDQFESLLDESDNSRDMARTAIDDGDYEEARRRATDAMADIDAAKELAEDHVYLSQTETETRLEDLAGAMIESLSKRVAEIDGTLRSQSGQDRTDELAQELVEVVSKLKSLHQKDLSDDTERDIVIVASETQKVLLAARLLRLEFRALTGEQQFNDGDYGAAKDTFEDVATKLEELETTTSDEAVEEYEAELDEFMEVCETNSERARKLNLGLESGLRPESSAIIGPRLRSEGGSASTSDTNVFDPDQIDNEVNETDTKIFSPSNVEGSGTTASHEPEETKVYSEDDSGRPD